MNEIFIKAVDGLNLKFPIADIARKLSYSKGLVSDYMNGKKETSRAFLIKFCEAYKLDYDKLFKEKINTMETKQLMYTEVIFLMDIFNITKEELIKEDIDISSLNFDDKNTKDDIPSKISSKIEAAIQKIALQKGDKLHHYIVSTMNGNSLIEKTKCLISSLINKKIKPNNFLSISGIDKKRLHKLENYKEYWGNIGLSYFNANTNTLAVFDSIHITDEAKIIPIPNSEKTLTLPNLSVLLQKENEELKTKVQKLKYELLDLHRELRQRRDEMEELQKKLALSGDGEDIRHVVAKQHGKLKPENLEK